MQQAGMQCMWLSDGLLFIVGLDSVRDVLGMYSIALVAWICTSCAHSKFQYMEMHGR